MSRNFPDINMLASATRTQTVIPAFSFAFWFKMNTPLGGPGNFFGYPFFTDNNFFLLFYNSNSGFGPGFDSTAVLSWTDSVSGAATLGTGVFGLPLEGNWFHFAGTLDYAGDKKFHLYINGVEATNFVFPSDAGSGVGIDFTPLPGNPYPIGWNFGSDARDAYALDGYIEDARLWSVGLTASEVLQVSQGQNIRYADLIGWWKFCGNNSPEPDSSANNNPMLLSTPAPLAGPHALVNICAGQTTKEFNMANIFIKSDNNNNRLVFSSPGESPLPVSAAQAMTVTGSNPNLGQKSAHGQVAGVIFDNPGASVLFQ